MIYYFHCDGNGTDSISDVIDNESLVRIPVVHFEDFDRAVTRIVTKLTPQDTVIVDTINMLAATTRADINLGVDASQALWGMKEKYFKDKAGFGLYTAPTAMIIRHLKNCSRNGEGAKIIVTCHEGERTVDELTGEQVKKRAPDLNKELLAALIGSSSDVFRLTKIDREVTNEKGEVILSENTRIMQLHGTEDFIAKFQVPMSRAKNIKKAIANPTYPMLCEHLGKVPTWLTIYSPPGVGKSTFVTSMLRKDS